MSFLTAEWQKLAMVNYEIDPDLLTPYVPYGTILDLFEGTCYVSLVGFMFTDTKLKGVSIPFHKNFEEVNLRFYVKYFENGYWKRGVVFIKEIVPKPALTFVANKLYKEHYQTLPMQHRWDSNDEHQTVDYRWKVKNQWQQIEVKAAHHAVPMQLGSETEFIAEHYYGYTKQNNKTFEYKVKHPRWDVFPVIDYNIDVDFGLNYGSAFSVLNDQKPLSVVLAEGSEISVGNKLRVF